MGLCEWLVRKSHRQEDSPEDRNAKAVLVVTSAIAGSISVMLVGIDGAKVDGVHDVGVLLTMVSWAGCLAALVFSSPSPRRLTAVVLFGSALGIILMDWNAAAMLTPRLIPVAIVFLDLALVVDVPMRHQLGILGLCCAWIFVERAEAAARFGLYENYVFSSADREVLRLCDCSNPPCSIGFVSGSLTGIIWLVALGLDYHCTRSFSRAMRAQYEIVDTSVRVSEKIAQLLASYSVNEAQELVTGDQSRVLPRDLKEAYEKLLRNLESYRPFLPDSLLYAREGMASERTSPFSLDRDMSPPGWQSESPMATICFTDIESSTDLWDAFPQSMFDAIRDHNDILRTVGERWNGYEVKTIGDSFMMAFHEPADGINFCLDVQEDLVRHSWTGITSCDLCRPVRTSDGDLLWHGLRVRAGVNAGPVRLEQNPISNRWDYFGTTVNVAARVEGLIRKGGVVCATNAALVSAGNVPKQVVAIPLGAVSLRGVKDKVEVTALFPQALRLRWDLVRVSDVESEHSGLGVGKPRARVHRRSVVSAASSSTSSPLSDGCSTVILPLDGPALSHFDHHLRRTHATAACVRAAVGVTVQETQVFELAALVEQGADMTGGVVLGVISVTCTVVWNALRRCLNHPHQATHFFQNVLTRAPDHAHIGAATGFVMFGNVAAGRRRFPNVFGGCVELACSLAEEAAGNCEAVLVSAALADVSGGDRYHRAQVWTISGERLVVYGYNFASEDSDSEDDDTCRLQLLTRPRDNSEWQYHDLFIRASLGEPEAIATLRLAAADASCDDDQLHYVAQRAASGTLRGRQLPLLFDPSSCRTSRTSAQ
eukprot:TRINITY_DN10524_c0_g1_i1.p1 TRINITY_DN10524_c0_g1~~TRINITY_DN10524_c0_g1_i1.p1  ORF type:complete len:825 (+),score=129.00 TRINITY_DN10524_c0_g1_i1:45-2519(+)